MGVWGWGVIYRLFGISFSICCELHVGAAFVGPCLLATHNQSCLCNLITDKNTDDPAEKPVPTRPTTL